MCQINPKQVQTKKHTPKTTQPQLNKQMLGYPYKWRYKYGAPINGMCLMAFTGVSVHPL